MLTKKSRSLKKPLLRALRGEIVKPPPIWLMRQAGRYLPEYKQVRQKAEDFLSLCYNPELATEVTLQPVARFSFDAAILFADILLIPAALGQPLKYVDGDGPILIPIRSQSDLSILNSSKLTTKLKPVYETVQLVSESLRSQKSLSDVALIGFAGAPWTVALYMVEGRGGGAQNFTRQWFENDPEGFSSLIELLIDMTVLYLSAQIDAGAEAIQIFDSWAGLLTGLELERWSIIPMAEITSRIRKDYPQVPIIGFPRGVKHRLLNYVQDAGIDAIGLDNSVELTWAASVLQPHCTVQGNLDQVLLRNGGAPMVEGVRDILENLAGGPFIFNLSHGVLPDTPVKHVSELCEIVREWNG